MTDVEAVRTEIRLALPSKGRMAEEVIDLLSSAGLHVYKPNPRQYRATIPSLPLPSAWLSSEFSNSLWTILMVSTNRW